MYAVYIKRRAEKYMSKLAKILQEKTLQSHFELVIPSHNQTCLIRQLTVAEDYLINVSSIFSAAKILESVTKILFDVIVDKSYFKKLLIQPNETPEEFEKRTASIDDITAFYLTTTSTDLAALSLAVLQHSYDKVSMGIECTSCGFKGTKSVPVSSFKVKELKTTSIEELLAVNVCELDLSEYILKIHYIVPTTADYMQLLSYLSKHRPDMIFGTDPNETIAKLIFGLVTSENVSTAEKSFISRTLAVEMVEKETGKSIEMVARDRFDIKLLKTEKYYLELLKVLKMLPMKEADKLLSQMSVTSKESDLTLAPLSVPCPKCGVQIDIPLLEPLLFFLSAILKGNVQTS